MVPSIQTGCDMTEEDKQRARNARERILAIIAGAASKANEETAKKRKIEESIQGSLETEGMNNSRGSEEETRSENLSDSSLPNSEYIRNLHEEGEAFDSAFQASMEEMNASLERSHQYVEATKRHLAEMAQQREKEDKDWDGIEDQVRRLNQKLDAMLADQGDFPPLLPWVSRTFFGENSGASLFENEAEMVPPLVELRSHHSNSVKSGSTSVDLDNRYMPAIPVDSSGSIGDGSIFPLAVRTESTKKDAKNKNGFKEIDNFYDEVNDGKYQNEEIEAYREYLDTKKEDHVTFTQKENKYILNKGKEDLIAVLIDLANKLEHKALDISRLPIDLQQTAYTALINKKFEAKNIVISDECKDAIDHITAARFVKK